MVDHTAPWILFGLLIAAAITPSVLATLSISQLPPVLDVLVFALLGIPTFVCASAATPLVAVLVAGGVSPGAGLAFLLSGPATNLSTIGILSRVHGRSFGVLFAAAVGLGAVAAGVITNLVLRGWTPVALGAQITLPPTTLEITALGVLVLLTCWSLLRRGPRAFFGELALAVTSDRHAHEHHAHEHRPHAHQTHEYQTHEYQTHEYQTREYHAHEHQPHEHQPHERQPHEHDAADEHLHDTTGHRHDHPQPSAGDPETTVIPASPSPAVFR